MKLALIALITLLCPSAYAEDVFRIEIGKNKSGSHSELQNRVWELERAVWQLQQKVFNLENKNPSNGSDSWLCTVKAMGTTYTGTGGSRAVAKSKAIDVCKAARGGDGFFCKDPECEQ